MEFNFLSLCLGGFLAGLSGFACFRIEAWRNNRNGKRGLANALEADLRSSIELYTQLIDFWESKSTILFDYLDQLTFVRSNYNTDRPHFGMLSDEDMRNRLNYYFRTSYVTLNKLRSKQERIYLTDSEDEKAPLAKELSNQIEELRDHRQAATELADQLSIRFLSH